MLTNQEQTRDLRVRRTHMLLRKAFMELMHEKGFQSITVQDIADRAMVNRATFYDHFVDKYALMEYSLRERFRETLISKVPEAFTLTAAHLRLLILTTCEFLAELRHGCMPNDQQILLMMQSQITSVIFEIILNWITSGSANASPDAASAHLTATMTSWAIYGAALHWSQTNGQTSEEFVTKTFPAIVAMLKQAMDVA